MLSKNLIGMQGDKLGPKLSHLSFAHDIIIITDVLGEAKQMLYELKETCSGFCLKTNCSKTRIVINLILKRKVLGQ